MLDFPPDTPKEPTSYGGGVPNGQEIPKELDIFYKAAAEFLPEGKTFKDLTLEEQNALIEKYRFSILIPGIYQGITGFTGAE